MAISEPHPLDVPNTTELGFNLCRATLNGLAGVALVGLRREDARRDAVFV